MGSEVPPWLQPGDAEKRMKQLFPDVSKVIEHRVDLPLSVEEYHVGQLYGVAEASKNETGGGDGVEVIKNEPFEYGGMKGQYTLKAMHLSSKVPNYVRVLSPKGALTIYEEAWNCYPWCRTIYTNAYMKDTFYVALDSWHKDGNGDTHDNVHALTGDNLTKRQIVRIDIVNDTDPPMKEGEDPRKFMSEKAKRGPWAGDNWSAECQPVMCCYKLYYIKFKWFGLQTKIESMIVKAVKRILANLHRQVVCWLDKWYGMTMEDIRELERETKQALNEKRQRGEVQGMVVKE